VREWPNNELLGLLGIDHPIIQAPMSGLTTPALAAAVSNAGGVGSLGCAEFSLQQLREQFDQTRSSTTRPFNINFFAHDTPSYPTDGTAFLLCPESAASGLYREALQQARDDGTRLTRAFTGRPARAITNRFVEEMASHEREAAPFPLQDSLTLPLHIRSEERGSVDFAALLSGQAAPLCRALPAGELIDLLVAEAQSGF